MCRWKMDYLDCRTVSISNRISVKKSLRIQIFLSDFSWGEWGKEFMCPNGTRITQCQLCVEPDQGDGDDTAVKCNYHGLIDKDSREKRTKFNCWIILDSFLYLNWSYVFSLSNLYSRNPFFHCNTYLFFIEILQWLDRRLVWRTTLNNFNWE
jgi:hypothetical protein